MALGFLLRFSTAMLVLLAITLAPWESAFAQVRVWPFLPEQQRIQIRDPSQLMPSPVPDIPRPETVLAPRPEDPSVLLHLDDAIRIALTNAEVIRVLAGVTAVTSGRSVYDAAITNTAIDVERARFDPRLEIQNTWNHIETIDTDGFPFDGSQIDDYTFNLGLAKTNLLGGEFNFGVNSTTTRSRPSIFQLFPDPLNPDTLTSPEVSYVQPLLQGAGLAANRAPIVIARIETERSFFQFKDSVQDLVQGVIEAYWALVFARVDLWAREQQVELSEFAFERSRANLDAGLGDAGDVAQSRVALANFRANLIAAQSNVFLREAALKNIMGLPPSTTTRFIPSTPPTTQYADVDWEALVLLATERRPDIVELKLVLEADEQQLIQANNLARPRLDAVGLYRWNGIEGELPNGTDVASEPGQFADWSLGINFSVPLGLRSERAQLRQVELLIARDRANLQQGIHNSVHLLALNVRNLAQFHEQYQAFREVRSAARDSLDVQLARYVSELEQYINVLQAIVDWGNAVSSEAQSISQYNTELANLERETGTILESHGVVFFEERFASIGPLGRLHDPRCYPEAMRPSENDQRYPPSNRPADEFFDLETPPIRRGSPLNELPEPTPLRN